MLLQSLQLLLTFLSCNRSLLVNIQSRRAFLVGPFTTTWRSSSQYILEMSQIVTHHCAVFPVSEWLNSFLRTRAWGLLEVKAWSTSSSSPQSIADTMRFLSIALILTQKHSTDLKTDERLFFFYATGILLIVSKYIITSLSHGNLKTGGFWVLEDGITYCGPVLAL